MPKARIAGIDEAGVIESGAAQMAKEAGFVLPEPTIERQAGQERTQGGWGEAGDLDAGELATQGLADGGQLGKLALAE